MMRSVVKGRSTEDREVIYFRMALIWGVLGASFIAITHIGASPGLNDMAEFIGGVLLLYSAHLCIRSVHCGWKVASRGDEG